MAAKPELCRKCMTIVAPGDPCNCPPKPAMPLGVRRYAVWFPKTGKYISDPRGGSGLAATRDLAEAKEMAGTDGQVVDADDFAKNYRAYLRGERTPQPSPSPREDGPEGTP